MGRSASPFRCFLTGRSIRPFGWLYDHPHADPRRCPGLLSATTNGDASVPLQVEAPLQSRRIGSGPDNKFGFTQFTITFDSTPAVTNPATYNYTGTYSYVDYTR